MLVKRRVIEQRKLALKTHGVSAGDRAWVEADRALQTNKRALDGLRNELVRVRSLT